MKLQDFIPRRGRGFEEIRGQKFGKEENCLKLNTKFKISMI
jgi:hypothetical protein